MARPRNEATVKGTLNAKWLGPKTKCQATAKKAWMSGFGFRVSGLGLGLRV